MGKQRIGFLPFASDDDDVFHYHTLVDKTSAQGPYSIVPNDQGTTGHLFDPVKGCQFNGGDGFKWDLDANITRYQELFSSMSNSFEIETAYIDNTFDTTGAQYFGFSNDSLWLSKDATFGTISFSGGSKTEFTGVANIGVSPVGKGEFTRIQCDTDRGLARLYIDDMLYTQQTNSLKITASSVTWSRETISGSLTVLPSGCIGWQRNYQLVSRLQMFPDSPEYGSIGFTGDSFMHQGRFPSTTYTAPNSNPYFPGLGFDSGGAATTTAGSFRDVGCQMAILRHLSKNGIWTMQNKLYAESGASYDGRVPVQQTAMFTDSHYRPKVIICGAGANDAINLATNVASVETKIKAMITEADGFGVNHYVLPTVISLHNSPTYQTTAYDVLTAAMNAMIPTLLAWSISEGHTMKVHLYDAFTDFGGHNLNADEFKPNNIHPNELGSYKYGLGLATALLTSA